MSVGTKTYSLDNIQEYPTEFSKFSAYVNTLEEVWHQGNVNLGTQVAYNFAGRFAERFIFVMKKIEMMDVFKRNIITHSSEWMRFVEDIRVACANEQWKEEFPDSDRFLIDHYATDVERVLHHWETRL